MEITPSELQKEYIFHGGLLDAAIGMIVAAMPSYIDPSGGVSDQDDRQMMRDPAVVSAVDTLTLGTLADGITVSPAFAQVPHWRRERPASASNPEERQAIQDADAAAETSAFVKRQIAEMEGELLDVAENLLDGMLYRWQSAEAVYKWVENGPDRGKLGLKSLTAKPRDRLGARPAERHGSRAREVRGKWRGV